MDLSWILDNANETEYVDYKKDITIHRSEEDKNEFIMDMISFANNPHYEEKYLVYGVVVDPATKEKSFPGINPADFKDGAVYQELIESSVDHRIPFELIFFEHKGIKLAAFRIYNCSPPYLASLDRVDKTTKKIRKDDFWYRAGDHKIKGGREVLEIIYEARAAKKEMDDQKVRVFFEGSRTDQLEVKTVGEFKIPSLIRAEKIMALIEKERQTRANERYRKSIQGMIEAPLIYGSRPLDEMTEDELSSEMEKIRSEYVEDDIYEVYELRGNKLQIIVAHDNHTFIDDAIVQVKFQDEEGMLVAPYVAAKPVHDHGWYGIPVTLNAVARGSTYPTVLSKKPITLRTEVSRIEHNIDVPIFVTPPRLAFFEDRAGKEIGVSVEIHARNLPRPIVRKLHLKVVERGQSLPDIGEERET